MSPRDWILRLQDIGEALQRIADYTAGMTAEDFMTDHKTADAVIRNLEVIGEAARYLPSDVSARYPEIPWAEMRALRNILAHEYFGVSLPILWRTVTHDLPPIAPLLAAILEQETSIAPERDSTAS